MAKKLEVGSKVTQMIGGLIPQELTITEITEDKIVCGEQQFNKNTGVEVINPETIDLQSHLLLNK